MLITPSNGIMFLASTTFLAIGLVGWLLFPKRDVSAKLWMLGFVIAGVAPLLGTVLGGPEGALAFVLTSTLLAFSFFLFGVSLRSLNNPSLWVKEYLFVAAIIFPVYALLLAYTTVKATAGSQIILFALGNGLTAAWAAQEAIRLSQRQPSQLANHLIFVFGAQATVIFFRILQVMQGDERRLWEPSVINEILLSALCLLGIIKAVAYFALRYEEVRERLARETEIIQAQAAQLARKNAEVASAMHVVPVACIVTHPSLDILYLNAEARRLFGDHTDSKIKLSDWVIGLRNQGALALTAARHVLIRQPDSAITRAMAIEVSGVDGDTEVAQWVFALRPVNCSVNVLESIWTHIPRVDNRTWLVCDHTGLVISAQSAWGEVLGPWAIMRTPELRFGGISEPRDAKGLDLWATLKTFNADLKQLERTQSAQREGKASSLLLRDTEGARLSCGLTPIHCEGTEERLWLAELSYRPDPKSVNTRSEVISQNGVSILLATRD
ncbi:MAG: hypothetical protein ACO3OV_04290 [Steroidobacteraceae bacterium]